jgi:hypothetical protein
VLEAHSIQREEIPVYFLTLDLAVEQEVLEMVDVVVAVVENKEAVQDHKDSMVALVTRNTQEVAVEVVWEHLELLIEIYGSMDMVISAVMVCNRL